MLCSDCYHFFQFTIQNGFLKMNNQKDNLEARRESRQEFKDTVFIEILASSSSTSNDQVVLECTTLDVSSKGLKIKTDHPLLLRSILELNLSFEKSKKEFQLIGEVRWSRCIDESHYEAGFELLDADHVEMETWNSFLSKL